MYVQRPYTHFALGRSKDLAHIKLRQSFSKGEGTESTCVIKRKNETTDVEK